MTIKRYVIRKIGECKGHKRIYLDMADLTTCGFAPGKNYKRTVDAEKKCITLTVAEEGGYVVSQKEKAGRKLPIIDINSSAALEPFEGMQAIRVIVQKDKIFILPIASEAKRLDRLNRLATNMATGTIKTAGAAFGGGVLDHAAHTGLKASGIDSSLVFANEIDDDLLEHATHANEIITADTLVVSAPMQELVQDAWAMQNVPQADILSMGIPCSGASIAGKSKRGLAMMENHPEVGHLVASAVMLINRINPAVLVIENVTQYADTASAQILRQHLRDSGYIIQETVLSASDFGCIENRERWFMVASTAGIPMQIEDLAPTLKISRTLVNYLEPIPDDSPMWRDFAYLKTKQDRDAAKGNGFNMQTYTPESNSVGVIRKGYSKGGSTDPLLMHPSNPELLRQFTVVEHARIKGVPSHLVEGLSATDGHIVLGQGVCYAPVSALFKRIGECLKEWMALAANHAFSTPAFTLKLATG